MASLWQDLRYALRMLVKSPGFAAFAIITLALGIGANTAMFSLINAVLLRPLPYPNPDQLVTLDSGVFPRGAYVGFRDLDRSVDFAAYEPDDGFNLVQGGEPVRLHGSAVSAGFFDVFGVKPQIGRAFARGDDTPGHDNIVVLSYALWQKRFGSDPGIVGRWARLNGSEHQVIGVMPPSFHYPSDTTELWIPLRIDPRNAEAYWNQYTLQTVGRLRAGFTLAAARSEIRSITPQVRRMFPYAVAASWDSSFSMKALLQSIVSDVQTRLLILLGAVGFVLLIACATVANLLLARATTRQREIAVRMALGAGRWRIARQLIAETMPLAIGGGALGFVIAIWSVPLLLHILPRDTPRLINVSLDLRVLAFTAALAILTGFLFGAIPGLRASRGDLEAALRANALSAGASRSRRKLSSAFVVGEVAVALIVVVGGGLLVKSLWKLSAVNPGFHQTHIFTAELTPEREFCSVPARCIDFYDEVLRRIASQHSAESAALINVVPLSGMVNVVPFDAPGHPRLPGEGTRLAWENIITPSYLQTMGLKLLSGRTFTDADAEGALRVVLISQSLARRFWPGQNAIGEQILTLGVETATPWTIVGVVNDVREVLLQKDPGWYKGEIYFPYRQAAFVSLGDRGLNPDMALVVRTTSDEAHFGDDIRRVVATVNPEVPVSTEQTMAGVIATNIAAPRSTTWLFVVFGVLALVMGALGIYSVISYSVAQQIHEIGVRMALGAQRKDVLRLVLDQGATLAIIGIAIGTAVGLVLARLMKSLLFGVSTADPLTYVGVAVLLMVVALSACYAPARRAMRVDPMVALRYE